MRRGVLVGIGTLVAACSAFGVSNNDGGGGVPPALDGGLDSALPSEDVGSAIQQEGGAQDSGDGGVADACAVVVDNERFDSFVNWRRLNDAQIVNNAMRLTSDMTGQTGGLWRQLPAPAMGFSVKVTLVVSDSDNDPADGFTIAWSAKDPVIGSSGQKYGLCGGQNDAVAFIINTWQEQIGVIDTPSEDVGAGCGPTTGRKPFAIKTPPTHRIDIELSLRGNMVEVLLNGVPTTFTAPRTFPISWIGFTASTGGSTASHTIDDVTIAACK